MIKKKLTLRDVSEQIETLAAACAKNFKRIDERFEAIDRRFERIEKRMDLAETRWQKITNTVINDHEPRICVIENTS
jgi:uncharacterized protein YhaN